MKQVLLNEVYFNEDRLTLEIIDDKNIKRYINFFTDKFKDYYKNVSGNRIVLEDLLIDMAKEEDDPSLCSLLSDASYVTRKGYSIYSWVRDDYVFSIHSRA